MNALNGVQSDTLILQNIKFQILEIKDDKNLGKKLDFKEIKLSSKIRDIHKIEKKSISIRVFGYENKEKHQIYKPKICCKETHVDLLLLGKEGKRQIIFKNNLPICDIFGNPYIC